MLYTTPSGGGDDARWRTPAVVGPLVVRAWPRGDQRAGRGPGGRPDRRGREERRRQALQAGGHARQQGLDLLDVAAGLLEGRHAAIAHDRVLARVVPGQGQVHVAPEEVEEQAEVPHAAEDVLARVEGVGHPEALRGERHELHEAARALGRDGQGVPLRLDLDHCLHERRAHAVVGGRLLDVLVVLAGIAAAEAEGVDEAALAR
jgi:hypothetical protein